MRGLRRLGRAGLRRPRTVLALFLTGAISATTLIAGAEAATPPSARVALAVNATDTAHLHYVKSSGALLLEEGSATGVLPGAVKARLNIGATVIVFFTISTRGGALTGHGSGAVHGTGVYASFGGTMAISSGTGRYAHAHGHGGFYGVLNRSNDALTVQTTGTLTY